MICTTLLLLSGCTGEVQEDYDALIATKTSLESENAKLESEMHKLESESIQLEKEKKNLIQSETETREQLTSEILEEAESNIEETENIKISFSLGDWERSPYRTTISSFKDTTKEMPYQMEITASDLKKNYIAILETGFKQDTEGGYFFNVQKPYALVPMISGKGIYDFLLPENQNTVLPENCMRVAGYLPLLLKDAIDDKFELSNINNNTQDIVNKKDVQNIISADINVDSQSTYLAVIHITSDSGIDIYSTCIVTNGEGKFYSEMVTALPVELKAEFVGAYAVTEYKDGVISIGESKYEKDTMDDTTFETYMVKTPLLIQGDTHTNCIVILNNQIYVKDELQGGGNDYAIVLDSTGTVISTGGVGKEEFPPSYTYKVLGYADLNQEGSYYPSPK